MAQEYVALVEDVPVEQVDIASITVNEVSGRIEQAAADRRRAKELDTAAARAIKTVAEDLHAESVPLVDIGAILGVSHQRAHQLVNA